MKNQKESIRKIVSFINNYEEQGGLWLPHIQRKFVWETNQIEALFDSIMREYPISTMLTWKTKEHIRYRKFIDNYVSDLRIKDFYLPADDKPKLLVLDGQQRLQSLFIALKGSYEGKELYIDILSGSTTSSNNIKYKFKFFKQVEQGKSWIKFKDLISSNKQYVELAEEIISKIEDLEESDEKLIRYNIGKIVKLFKTDEVVSYQELDSIDDPELYDKNDVVEIFIRANSGGTILEKSDLLFSLLEAGWDFAEENMESLLGDLNSLDYNFTRDFVLKTCLCLIGAGAKYEVEKFRKKENLELIENDWENISSAIKDVKDFINSKTFIKTGKALSSYLPLIPIIFFRYKFKEKWQAGVPFLEKWLIKILLTGAFSGSPDSLIDRCNKAISQSMSFDLTTINKLITDDNRNINITENTITSSYYDGPDLYLLFNLWYTHFDFNFTPSYKGHLPEVDHIFPQSKLREIKVVDPSTGRQYMKYRDFERNQIANCMLLTRDENGMGGKGETTPEIWFKDKDDKYLNMHLIPRNKDLWKIDNYEKFIEERKKLLIENFSKLING